MATIEENVESLLNNDEAFQQALTNAIESLLEQDSDFLTNVKEQLKKDIVFTTEIVQIMSSNDSIINAIAANQVLINNVSNNVQEQLTTRLKETFVDLVNTTEIEVLGNTIPETLLALKRNLIENTF